MWSPGWHSDGGVSAFCCSCCPHAYMCFLQVSEGPRLWCMVRLRWISVGIFGDFSRFRVKCLFRKYDCLHNDTDVVKLLTPEHLDRVTCSPFEKTAVTLPLSSLFTAVFSPPDDLSWDRNEALAWSQETVLSSLKSTSSLYTFSFKNTQISELIVLFIYSFFSVWLLSFNWTTQPFINNLLCLC